MPDTWTTAKFCLEGEAKRAEEGQKKAEESQREEKESSREIMPQTN